MGRPTTLGRLVIAATVSATLAAGCGVLRPPSDDDVDDVTVPGAPDAPQDAPDNDAAEAGGVCAYLDFTAFGRATGQEFSVAESGGADEVTSCVLLTTVGKLPEITFTRAQTATDVDTYQAEIPPKGAKGVDDMGDSAYSAVRSEEGNIGPAVEIGWLGEGFMYSLRYTTAAGTDKDEVAETLDAMVEVARGIAAETAADDEKDD